MDEGTRNKEKGALSLDFRGCLKPVDFISLDHQKLHNGARNQKSSRLWKGCHGDRDEIERAQKDWAAGRSVRRLNGVALESLGLFDSLTQRISVSMTRAQIEF